MLFKDVIGQTAIKERLMQMVQQDKIPHAQLFLGDSGVGTLPLALAFTQYVVCENKSGTDSCGQCAPCIKAGKLIHPDIHFTFPTVSGVKKSKKGKGNDDDDEKKTSKPVSADFIEEWRKLILAKPYASELDWIRSITEENKQANITADEARTIIRNLNMTPFEAKYKIHLIWMAENLGKEGNILLKLLEEPPQNTILILVAENQEELLSTIISRCQILKIPKIQDQFIKAELIQIGVTQSKAEHIAYLSDGNYNAALSLAESETDKQIDLLNTWFEYAIYMKVPELFRWVEETSKMGRENIKSFLEYVTHLLHESMLFKLIPDYNPRLTEDEIDLCNRLNRSIIPDKLEALLSLINKKHYEIERNVNPKMVLMDMSLKINQLVHGKAIE